MTTELFPDDVLPTVISFTCLGKPVSRGSKSPFVPMGKDGKWKMKPNGKPVIAMLDSTKERGRDWMASLRDTARMVYRGPLLTGPVKVSIAFVFSRKKSHYRSGRNRNLLKDSAPKHPTTVNDVDKLARAVLDAMKGILWRDDSQVCKLIAEKYWGEPAAAIVLVEQML